MRKGLPRFSSPGSGLGPSFLSDCPPRDRLSNCPSASWTGGEPLPYLAAGRGLFLICHRPPLFDMVVRGARRALPSRRAEGRPKCPPPPGMAGKGLPRSLQAPGEAFPLSVTGLLLSASEHCRPGCAGQFRKLSSVPGMACLQEVSRPDTSPPGMAGRASSIHRVRPFSSGLLPWEYPCAGYRS
jgi:hypothetical protein